MPGLLDYIPSQSDVQRTIADLLAKPRNRLRVLLDDPGAFLQSALSDVVPTDQQAQEQLSRYRMPASQDYAMGPSGYDNKMRDIALGALTVYHGSPHKFDKFDMSKIGTGEGKQQQGVGLYFAESKDVGQKYADRLADMHGKNEGNLYKVDLPDDAVSKFANYETSFMQQPETVRNAVAPLITDDVMHNLTGYYGWEKVDDAPMAAIMGALDISNGNSREVVTDLFRQNGIPGIRYLDGGSRNAGQGTYNYVVFDDTLPTILERNGQKLK